MGKFSFCLFHLLCDSILVLTLGFHLKKNTLSHPSLPVSVHPCWSLGPFPQLHPKATPEGCSLWYPSLRTKLGIKSSMGHMDAEALNERGKRGLGVVGDGSRKVGPHKQFPMEFLSLGFSLPAASVFPSSRHCEWTVRAQRHVCAR